MIILSYIEPIFDPITDDQCWVLDPSSLSTSTRNFNVSRQLPSSSTMMNPWASRQRQILNQQQQLQQRQFYQQQQPRYYGHLPAMDYDNHFLKYFGLPQFQPNEIEIQLDKENHQIVVNGKQERLNDTEFESCQFTKRILLPNNIDLDQIKCSIADNGLLQIEGPMNHGSDSSTSRLEREIPIEFVNQPTSEQKQSSPAKELNLANEEKMVQVERDPLNSAPPSKNINIVKKQPQQLIERDIPIEIVGKPKNVSMNEQFQQPQQIPIQNLLKNYEQLPPPPIDLPLIREIPIKMIKRPIDQGILCPCCNGRGSKIFNKNNNVCTPDHGHHHHDHHQPAKKQTHDIPIKIDYQPKNAPTTKTTSGSTTTNNKNIEISQPKPSQQQQKPSSEVIVEDIGMENN